MQSLFIDNVELRLPNHTLTKGGALKRPRSFLFGFSLTLNGPRIFSFKHLSMETLVSNRSLVVLGD